MFARRTDGSPDVAVASTETERKSAKMADVSIRMRENGPLLVTGPVTLVDHLGNTFDLGSKETFALCRCGQTKNRPFCDGTHKSCGWVAAELAPPKNPTPQ
jgi:CDGSH-type Zn-finger protein